MMPGRSQSSRLRQILAGDGCAIAVGAHDPAVAKLVDRAGFPVVYVSGSGASTAVAGFTDVGLLSFKEMLEHARYVVDATSLPALCDIDTGYGNTTNVKRTVREFEAMGAAGIHIEDQTFPKRCGQTAGASVIDVGEMTAKIYAAKEAQSTDDFVIAVRTDARQCEGFDAAVRRGRAYVKAGADAIFPEALLSPAEFRAYRQEVDAPLVIDVPEWGRSPTMSVSDLEEWGFDLAIFAISPLRVALGAVRAFLDDLATSRTQGAWIERMMTRSEMDDLLDLPKIRVDEKRLEEAGMALASEIADRAPDNVMSAPAQ